jgi:PDZ domain-containing protein
MTAPHSDLPAAPAPPSLPPEQIRKPKWPYAVAIVVSLAVIVALLGTMIRLPYVIYSPGDATPVQGIVKISGARSYRSRGEVLFLTVAVSRNRPNVWRFLQAKLDDDSEIIGEDRFLGGQSRKQVNRENVVAMDDSQLAAKKVALEQLGYKLTATGAGAKLMLVPRAEVKQARERAGDDLTVVGVDTIDQALHALREHGGAPVADVGKAAA